MATTRKITQITIALKRISLSLFMYKISAGRWFRARVATPHLSRAQTRFTLLLLDPLLPPSGKDAAEAPSVSGVQRKGRKGHTPRDFLGVLHNIPS